MKVFLAVCIFTVLLAFSAAVQAVSKEREVEEDNLVDTSAEEAGLEERFRNLVMEAYENVRENYVPAEERLVLYPYCFNQCGTFPACHPCKKG